MLVTLACTTNMLGEYIAQELALEQTLDNLEVFGERVAKTERQFMDATCSHCGEPLDKPSKAS